MLPQNNTAVFILTIYPGILATQNDSSMQGYSQDFRKGGEGAKYKVIACKIIWMGSHACLLNLMDLVLTLTLIAPTQKCARLKLVKSLLEKKRLYSQPFYDFLKTTFSAGITVKGPLDQLLSFREKGGGGK